MIAAAEGEPGQHAAMISAVDLFAGTSAYQGLLVTTSGSVASAEPGDFTATQPLTLQPSIDTLDLTGLSEDLVVGVRSTTPGRTTITVQEMNLSDGTGTGTVVTYEGGEIRNLRAGHDGKKVKLVLESAMESLDLSSVGSLQFALGKEDTA